MAQGNETVFAKIIRREIPADIVFENEAVLAFRDINPKAPVHVLIIPKKPIKSVTSAAEEDYAILGRVLMAAAEIARQEGVAEKGYRLVINNGADAGQEVSHLHVHLLAGRRLGWPPG